jgi:outer membrane protein TolC
MFPKTLRVAAVAAALLPVLGTAAPLTLEQAIERAVQRSEATRSARAGVLGASQAARAAGPLPDPMLGVSLDNVPVTGPDRFRTNREDMTMKRIALSQEWVSPHKRQLRASAADAMVAREVSMVAAAAAEARLQTALAYLDLYYASQSLEVNLHSEAHAREAAETARQRLAAGGGSAPEVLALTTEQGLAADEAAASRQQVASAAANLARWTGGPPDELAPPAVPAPPGEEDFVNSSAMVLAKRREIEVARAEAAVMAANRKPNWTWEVAYGQRTGNSDLMSVGVTIPLPVAPGVRQDRETASKLSLVDKAEAELAEAMRAAQGEYRMLASDAQRLRQRIQSYASGVLAPARQRTQAATAAYGANMGSLAMVFEARHAELESHRKLLNLQRDLAKTQAQLAFKPLKAEDLQ